MDQAEIIFYRYLAIYVYVKNNEAKITTDVNSGGSLMNVYNIRQNMDLDIIYDGLRDYIIVSKNNNLISLKKIASRCMRFYLYLNIILTFPRLNSISFSAKIRTACMIIFSPLKYLDTYKSGYLYFGKVGIDIYGFKSNRKFPYLIYSLNESLPELYSFEINPYIGIIFKKLLKKQQI
ncbi:hypothetical protein ACR3K2_04680 [Cryptosporidium serpentis]